MFAPAYVNKEIRHSSINITQDTDSHLLKPANQQATVKLEKTAFEKNGKFF